MTEFCGVHLTTKENGICKWCQGHGVLEGMDGRDDRLKPVYDDKTGLVAKPTRQDDQVASYEDPWTRSFFQPYMDFQPAPGWSDLTTFNAGEYGSMEVRGELANELEPDSIGGVMLRINAAGEQTVSIRSRCYAVEGRTTI